MKSETQYAYRKRIAELEGELNGVYSKLADYKDTVRQIYDGLIEVTSNGNTSVKVSWLLSCIRKCLK